MRSSATGLPSPRLAARDAAAEAVAGIVQRPGRAGLTMLGTVLGVGAFVAVLGLTATGAGQISHQFTVLEDTTVTVEDNGPANNVAPPGTNPAIGFPADADQVADRVNGVTAAGVWWPVSLPEDTNFTGSLALSATADQTVSLLAASGSSRRSMWPLSTCLVASRSSASAACWTPVSAHPAGSSPAAVSHPAASGAVPSRSRPVSAFHVFTRAWISRSEPGAGARSPGSSPAVGGRAPLPSITLLW